VVFLILCLLAALSACGQNINPTGEPLLPSATPLGNLVTSTPSPTETIAPLPPAPRVLTVCLGREPSSLFLYEANSQSEQSVLAAVYDGPFETGNYTPRPVILEKMPSLADGDLLVQPVEVKPGELMVNSAGTPVQLAEGVSYRPAGCTETACAVTYSGNAPVQMDQVRARFTLLAGLQWSDGAPLSADDSLYSYEVAQALYPAAVPELVAHTASYSLLDEHSVEWVGLPGHMDGHIQDKFFSPLPRHAWGAIPAQELPASESASRMPLGWGAYEIEEWVAGDHITLHKNPLYFRSTERLPAFDYLVYRFVADGSEALSALMAGECDLVDQTAGLESQRNKLVELQDAGQIQAVYQAGTAWELIQFGIDPLDEERTAFFAIKAVRQAVAMCIDRQAMVAAIGGDPVEVAHVYLPAEHPLYNAEAVHYAFDPQRAGEMLTSAGWVDLDNDPSTPRTAQGAADVADGSLFVVEYLTTADAERQAIAQQVQAGLAQCGIQVNLVTQPIQEYLAPGPEGPVFGRRFDLAHLAWLSSVEPPCPLYLTSEIPGPYPQYARGWGGANAAGYSNLAYDAACWDGLYALSELPQRQSAHAEAQRIFAQDFPALPLFWRFKVVAARADFCGLVLDASSESALDNIEIFDYGEGCND
jgi:peptide/nickel transport system substrate-binding protein